MAQLTHKTVPGRVGRAGQRAKDRTIYLVKWLEDGKPREKRRKDRGEAERRAGRQGGQAPSHPS